MVGGAVVGVAVGGGGVVGVAVGGGAVGGGVDPAGAKPSTSWGVLSPFSRLWNCCSASAFSTASRIRKPWLTPPYIAATWEVTFHWR
jgi:hypothetical protein